MQTINQTKFMKIRWNNLSVLVLALGALIFFLWHREEARGFLSAATRIGPDNSTGDMTLGLITIGICGAVLVAIVKILCQGRSNDPHPPPRRGPPTDPEA